MNDPSAITLKSNAQSWIQKCLFWHANPWSRQPKFIKITVISHDAILHGFSSDVAHGQLCWLRCGFPEKLQKRECWLEIFRRWKILFPG
jgi:hypothetical protein